MAFRLRHVAATPAPLVLRAAVVACGAGASPRPPYDPAELWALSDGPGQPHAQAPAFQPSCDSSSRSSPGLSQTQAEAAAPHLSFKLNHLGCRPLSTASVEAQAEAATSHLSFKVNELGSRALSAASVVARAEAALSSSADAKAGAEAGPLAEALALRTLGVVGAGQMGSGIAQLGAMAGMEVVMVDHVFSALGRGMRRIESSLDKLVQKDTLSQEAAEAAVARIKTSNALGDLEASDFVVEAVAEDEELKRALFSQLDKVTAPHTILASNTSAISITLVAAATSRPQKVIGMHFMNPPPIMSLVEIVRGLATNDSTTEVTKGLAQRLGKTVCYARDYPGFIVNRLLMPMINEAFYALLEGVGSAEDIDIGMTAGTNQPMGPLTLADFIGLDTCAAIMRVLHTRLGDAKYRPCPLLMQYVDAGWLGRKSGRGVYVYNEEEE